MTFNSTSATKGKMYPSPWNLRRAQYFKYHSQ